MKKRKKTLMAGHHCPRDAARRSTAPRIRPHRPQAGQSEWREREEARHAVVVHRRRRHPTIAVRLAVGVRSPQSCAPPDVAYKPWRRWSRPYRVGSPACREEPATNTSPTLDLCDGGGEEAVRGRGAGEVRGRETLSTLNE
jgi:hypothetical protein